MAGLGLTVPMGTGSVAALQVAVQIVDRVAVGSKG